MSDSVPARDRIVDAYYDLLSKHGRNGVVLKQLCSLAQVNRTTFYYHFHSIKDLEQHVVGEFMDGLFLAGITPLLKDASEGTHMTQDELSYIGWLAITRFVYDNKAHARELIRCGFQDAMVEAYLRAYRHSPISLPIVAAEPTPDGNSTRVVPQGALNAFVPIHSAYNALCCVDFIVQRGFRDSVLDMGSTLHSSFPFRLRPI